MFATLTGLIQLSNVYWSKSLGNLYNRAFEVTNKDFTNMWKLYTVSTISAAVPILFIWVAPSNNDIRRTQKVIKFLDEYEEASHQKDMNTPKEEQFKYLRQSTKKKDAMKKNKKKNKDLDEPEDENYNFAKEIKDLDPKVCRQLGIYTKIFKDYGL